MSWRSRAFYATMWTLGHSLMRFPYSTERTVEAAQNIDRLAARAPLPPNTTVTPTSFDGFGGEWVRSRHAKSEPEDGVVLYFHGGAFFSCGLNTHRYGVAALSAYSRLPVLSVDYRQLPSTPIAGSVADCVTAYRTLLDNGIPPERITFAGDSAGGYLVFATALAAREMGLKLPAALAGLSPLLELDSSNRLEHPNYRRDTYLPVHRLNEATELWLAEGDRLTDPIDADLNGMPPSLIMCAESEVLRADAEEMARRLWAADAECKLQIWRGQVHAFPVLGAFLPETKIAMKQAAAFAREHVVTGDGNS